MCGRFTLTASGEELAEAFGLDEVPDLAPRFNIAPSQPVLVVKRSPHGRRVSASLQWGLALPAEEEPSTSKSDLLDGLVTAPARRPLLINARAESVSRRPAFREAFRRRRCLVPADGFYEWKPLRQGKQPFHIRLREGGLFAFAGIWEPSADSSTADESLGSCTILTTEANEALLLIHDRMPVIVAPQDYERWLGAEPPKADILQALLGPFPPAGLVASPVGPAVNSATQEGAVCLEPAGPAPRPAQGTLFPDESDG